LMSRNTDEGIQNEVTGIQSEEILTLGLKDLKEKISKRYNKDDKKVEEITKEETESNLKYREKVDSDIESAIENGYINKEIGSRLRKKYLNQTPTKIESLESLLKSLMDEVKLNSLMGKFDEAVAE
jgi:hypothetical protein